MQFRKLSILLLGAVVLGSVLSFMPAANAQAGGTTVTVTITPSSDPVKPLQGAIQMPGQTTVVVDNTAQTNIVGMTLQYTVAKAPAWAQVVVSPATDVVAIPQQPGVSVTVTRAFTVSVSATQDAPAFTPDQITINAVVTPTSAGAGTAAKGGTGSQTVPIQAGFFSLIDTQLESAIQVARPQTAVAFPVKVTNFGNAQTKITFAIQDNPGGLNAPVPTPLTLQSKQQGGNQITAEVPLSIETPYHNGYLNAVNTITYKVTSAYALDSKQTGDSSVVSIVLTTKGFYVPGLELPIAIGIVGLAAIVLRRFRSA